MVQMLSMQTATCIATRLYMSRRSSLIPKNRASQEKNKSPAARCAARVISRVLRPEIVLLLKTRRPTFAFVGGFSNTKSKGGVSRVYPV